MRVSRKMPSRNPHKDNAPPAIPGGAGGGDAHAHPLALGGGRGDRNRENRESESRGAVSFSSPFHPYGVLTERTHWGGSSSTSMVRGGGGGGSGDGDGGGGGGGSVWGAREGGWQRRMPVGPSPRYESDNPRIFALSRRNSPARSRDVNPPSRAAYSGTEYLRRPAALAVSPCLPSLVLPASASPGLAVVGKMPEQ